MLDLEILKSLNLLLVEDDIEIRQNFSNTLGNFFQKVFVSTNGLEALEIFQNKTIDIILTDYVMPNMDGSELVAEIRKHDKEIPIVIISNYTEKEMLLKCIPLNLMGYLTKPMDYNALKNFLTKNVVPFFKAKDTNHYFTKETYFNLSKKELTVDGNTFLLTKLEASLLYLLTSSKGVVLPTEMIEEHIYGIDMDSGDGSGVKNLIYRIKKKYNFPYIKNIKETGYRIATEDEL